MHFLVFGVRALGVITGDNTTGTMTGSSQLLRRVLDRLHCDMWNRFLVETRYIWMVEYVLECVCLWDRDCSHERSRQGVLSVNMVCLNGGAQKIKPSQQICAEKPHTDTSVYMAFDELNGT